MFVFEILGIILGGFEGYLVSITLLASEFDLGRIAGTLFMGILFALLYGQMYLMLLGTPAGYCIGYFLKRPKLGLEIGTISGMIIIMPLLLGHLLFDFIYLISYVSMIIGIFVGKFVGIKLGRYFNEDNENASSEHKQAI